ncbi:DUF938 domain-containing protein [Methylicorpusculum oleiharenae]|uniref:DUF938 domain-containing protein n=1 Tax=Methylicorpusculum oleiharenae TaxID=1338687 RepID=UPI001358DAEC|nr:DUF938 domain-containing protein [Methylicorpusculum oleiharenae]MCD2452383.1 DUF938 domain-containing protein [Methylicorpusculum oleiharenae]
MNDSFQNQDRDYTSDNRAHFDDWLKQPHPLSCIKDFEDFVNGADGAGLPRQADLVMPTDNLLVIERRVFRRKIGRRRKLNRVFERGDQLRRLVLTAI